MQNLKLITVFILIAIIVITILISSLFFASSEEGFDVVPISTNPQTKQVITGYYQIDDSRMAMLPYGFKIDPNDPQKIIPTTVTNINMLKPKQDIPIPKQGDKMPEGYYLLSDSSLAILPPNMLPNLNKIKISEDNAKILYYYDIGYMSETKYYEKKFNPDNNQKELPEGVYYTDSNKDFVSLLKFGQIADKEKGYGYTMKKEDIKYREIEDNYNVQFHDDAETVKKQNDLKMGEVMVKDQNGNMILLPKAEAQGSVTFYQPGEFPFGASTYIPNYEDSIYLSSVGYRTMLGNTITSNTNCGAICKAYNEFKIQMDLQCEKRPQ
jgi:hypothetical protein